MSVHPEQGAGIALGQSVWTICMQAAAQTLAATSDIIINPVCFFSLIFIFISCFWLFLVCYKIYSGLRRVAL
jgi:hypothetical protein